MLCIFMFYEVIHHNVVVYPQLITSIKLIIQDQKPFEQQQQALMRGDGRKTLTF